MANEESGVEKSVSIGYVTRKLISNGRNSFGSRGWLASIKLESRE